MRRLFSLLCAAALILSLAGCGSSDPAGSGLGPDGRKTACIVEAKQWSDDFIEKSRFRQAAGEVVAVAALAQGGKQFAPRAQKRFLILRPQQTVQRLRHRPV